MLKFYADLHCHTTIRSLNSSDKQKNCIWEKTENPTSNTPVGRWIRKQTREIAKYSQANLYAAAKGNTRLLFDSLYPIEKGFINLRKVPAFLAGKKNTDELVTNVSGIKLNRYEYLLNTNDYFNELQEQYQFITQNQGLSPCGQYSYSLENHYKGLYQSLKNPNHVCIIPTIEGGHAFGLGTPETENLPLSELKVIVSKNIETLKKWQYPPFFITFAHHFWNQLCGHARSLKPPINGVFNQNNGINLGITKIGWHAINELLTNKNGKRVLIDVKHMSIQSRKELYKFIKQHNYISETAPIPIICSHTGYNGHHSLKELQFYKDALPRANKGYFHNWTINLCDEDIKTIHNTKGLIGIMIDKGMLGSINTLNHIYTFNSPNEQKKEFLRLIWNNIFGMVAAINEKNAWNTFCLGTDLDGLITHIDFYDTLETLPELETDLIRYLEKTLYKRNLWHQYEPAELVSKIMSTNVLDFLKHNF